MSVDVDNDAPPRILLLGYGNPGRQDDGLGPLAVERVAALGLDGVRCEAAFQLNIEDAALLAEHDRVLFVDASQDAVAPYEHWQAAPSKEHAFTSHAVSPESVLAICDEHFQRRPRASVLAIRGYEFNFAEGLSPRAQQNLEEALVFVKSLITSWKELKHVRQ